LLRARAKEHRFLARAFFSKIGSMRDDIPDVRDGLTRRERIVLHTLHELQREMNGRSVATAMLYGRVLERIDLSIDELQAILQKLGASSAEHVDTSNSDD
jgi:hypothetical protein